MLYVLQMDIYLIHNKNLPNRNTIRTQLEHKSSQIGTQLGHQLEHELDHNKSTKIKKERTQLEHRNMNMIY